MTRVTIFTAMSMNKVVFLWPAKLVGSGHKNADRWNSSAIEAAEAATLRKVRVQSNKALGAYESRSPTILRRRTILCGPIFPSPTAAPWFREGRTLHRQPRA